MARFSVIIPTLNEEKYLPLVIMSLRTQTYKDIEILVSDGGSIDKTIEIAKRCNVDRIVVNGKGILGNHLNEAARFAKGEFLARFDSDALYPKDWLEVCLKNFLADPSLAAVTSRVYPLETDSPMWLRIEYTLYNLLRGFMLRLPPPAKVALTSGTSTVIKTEQFNSVGGYDAVRVNEDGLLGRKLSRIGKIKMLNCLVYHSSRRAKHEGFFKFNRHYLYILSMLFPFSLFPRVFWRSMLGISERSMIQSHQLNIIESA